ANDTPATAVLHHRLPLPPLTPFGLVRRTLDRANLPSVLHRGEELLQELLLGAEELVNLRLRCVLGAQFPPLVLERDAVLFVRVLVPRRRQRRSRLHEVAPFQRRRVVQRRDVRLPRLRMLG